MERRGIGYWIPISVVIGICLLGIICLGVNAATIPERLNDFGEPIPEEYRLKAEPIIVEPIVVEPVKEPVMSDRDYIAQVVMNESKGERFIGKVAVAATVLNRSSEWDMTIKEVVEQPGQFSYPCYGIIYASCYRAVDFALENRGLFPKNMVYFAAGGYHKGHTDYMQIGNHYFSTDGAPEWDEEDLREYD